MATTIKILPGEVHYELWRGDTWQPGTITASINGTPINFTGYTSKMEIRNKISGELALTLTSGDGITMSSVGVITISMTAAQTNALLGRYKYDLEVTAADSTKKTYTYGTITVMEDNTNNA